MSIIKHTDQRIAVFIDTQNLYHSAKNIHRKRVNFANILKDAVSGRNLIRAIAYVISTEAGDEKNFFEALEKAGIETKVKSLQTFADGSKKADWDVGVAVDAIRLAARVDAVVIVSGDGDFVPLIEYLKAGMQTQVEVMAFGKASSQKLKEVADEFVDLSDSQRKYLMGGSSQTRGRRTRKKQ